jgi:hypothetical protein
MEEPALSEIVKELRRLNDNIEFVLNFKMPVKKDSGRISLRNFIK